ncbi:Crp/Fnr family transcriptional regulator [Ramlibacter sp. AN1133]|uniref:Crp/Fnr family transcriptional regulator n=1 Tax=Ramlibacter sp. AN1133 TaxID=3133429 RepID=UPI0030C47840
MLADPETGPRANRLLARLAGEDRARMAAHCESAELEVDQVLMRPGLRTTHAWFPLDAIVSLSMPAAGKPHSLSVAMVGAEGMVGIPLLLGSTASSLRAVVVREGAALRIPVVALRTQLRESDDFRKRMQQYVLVTLTQLAQATLCTRYHRVEERLARWLLMTQDRAPGHPVHATHEFLAATLGVRRAGVTRAAAVLQRRQLIAYHRGVMTVLDRDGLQGASCSCYAADCAAYASGMRA